MESAADDPRFLAGITCFNRRAFFEAHEVWEEIWREEQGPARRFYQGLIQLAVCLHHFGNGNTRGARKLCLSGCGYLQPYRPAYLGLDLERLLGDMEACCRELLARDEAIPRAQLDPSLIPTLVSPHSGS
jgi:predicted metal-dependent hydrolase